MKNIYFPALLIFLLSGCNNLEDAELTNRATFIRFYEGANSMVAAGAELTEDGGYIIAGTIKIEGDVRENKILVFKTNKFGQKEWEKIINGGSASGLQVTPQGYLVIGQSLVFNSNTSDIAELENASSRLVIFNKAGDITNDISYARKAGNTHIDYFGNAVTIDDATNTIITLGTYKEPGQNEYVSVTALDGVTLDTVWKQSNKIIEHDYNNARSIYYRDNKIVWCSSITKTENNRSEAYLSVPVILENTSFINGIPFGQNQDKLYLVNDLKPIPFGYAAIGTYAEPDGTKSNLFFIRINNNGNFEEETIRFFDGAEKMNVNASLSSIQDTGDAVTHTRDGGYILAGTTINAQYGSSDVWLIKINSSGDYLWDKKIGGRSGEVVSSIQEAPNGDLVICGTIQDGSAQTGGLSSIFLIRTDKNGELKD